MGFVNWTLLFLGADISSCRVLSFGKPVNAVIFNDVYHVHISSNGVNELSDSDGSGISVPRNSDVQEVFVDRIGPSGN